VAAVELTLETLKMEVVAVAALILARLALETQGLGVAAIHHGIPAVAAVWGVQVGTQHQPLQEMEELELLA
jgi:hypothetical protein